MAAPAITYCLLKALRRLRATLHNWNREWPRHTGLQRLQRENRTRSSARLVDSRRSFDSIVLIDCEAGVKLNALRTDETRANKMPPA